MTESYRAEVDLLKQKIEKLSAIQQEVADSTGKILGAIIEMRAMTAEMKEFTVAMNSEIAQIRRKTNKLSSMNDEFDENLNCAAETSDDEF